MEGFILNFWMKSIFIFILFCFNFLYPRMISQIQKTRGNLPGAAG